MKKLVKGVIYDDIDMEKMKNEMFDLIDDKLTIEQVELIPSSIEAKNVLGLNDEQIVNYNNTMDAIAALTRYNFNTGITHNLIIPKEALSLDLVKELEKVDFAKDLMDDYNDRVTDRIIDEELCEHTENVLPIQDKQVELQFYFDDKKVSKEEFIEKAEKDPFFNDLLKYLGKLGIAV